MRRPADVQSVGGVNVFREIRNVKTPDELTLLRHAALVNETALQTVANILDVGVTPRELLRSYRASMAEQGGYGSHMTGGGGSHPWLSHPNMSYRFKEGDVVYLDPAGHYHRYWGDIGRAAIVGDPHGEARRALRSAAGVPPYGDSAAPAGGAFRGRDGSGAAGGRGSHRGRVRAAHPLVGLEHYDHPQSLGTFLSENFDLEAGMVVELRDALLRARLGADPARGHVPDRRRRSRASADDAAGAVRLSRGVVMAAESVRLALVQTDPFPSVSENVEEVCAAVARHPAALVVFPELALNGYDLADVARHALQPDGAELGAVAAAVARGSVAGGRRLRRTRRRRSREQRGLLRRRRHARGRLPQDAPLRRRAAHVRRRNRAPADSRRRDGSPA